MTTPNWVQQAWQLGGPAGEIAAMYLHGPEAREYTPAMVADAMGALGIDVTVGQVAEYRNARKGPLTDG